MLKLEGNAKGRDVVVQIREKECQHKNIFWIALTIAIAIHFSGILLFKIQPFFISVSSRSAPVKVNIDTGQSSAFANAGSDSENIVDSIEPPPHSEPSFYHFPQIGMNNDEPIYDLEIVNSNSSFSTYELYKMPIEIPIKYKPLEMKISGNLFEKATLISGSQLFEDVKSGSGSIHENLIGFVVKVDSRSGLVFWEKPLSEYNHHDFQLGKKLLHQLQFQIDPEILELEGEITFILRETKKV